MFLWKALGQRSEGEAPRALAATCVAFISGIAKTAPLTAPATTE